MLDYDALHCLSEVLRYGGFDKGAQALHLTQSAVSQKIKRLELHLGSPVLVRTKPLKATPLGQQLLAHIQTLLQQGKVMGCISQTGTPITGGESARLGNMNYQLYASPAYIARYLTNGLSPDEVFSAPGLLYDEFDVALLTQYQSECLGVAPTLKHCHWYPSSYGFLQMAVAGVAWALLPVLQVKHEVASGQLVPLFPDKHLAVPLFWHWIELESDALGELSQCIKDVAKKQLP